MKCREHNYNWTGFLRIQVKYISVLSYLNFIEIYCTFDILYIRCIYIIIITCFEIDYRCIKIHSPIATFNT